MWRNRRGNQEYMGNREKNREAERDEERERARERCPETEGKKGQRMTGNRFGVTKKPKINK